MINLLPPNASPLERAIAAFEEVLVTPGSRFDHWLMGKKSALTKDELAGYQLFKSSGCIACHNGSAVGGNTFQKTLTGKLPQLVLPILPPSSDTTPRPVPID